MKKGEKTISVLTMTLLCGALLLLMAGSPHDSEEESQVPTTDTIPVAHTDSCQVIYDRLGLSAWVEKEAFRKAYDGYCQIKDRKKEVLTLIDFTKPSNEERLLVLDMAEGKLLFHSLVAHGRNSGDLYATRFSNRPESHQSSLGLYLTEGTYTGKNGYSLRLNGLEKGINDNALARAIVIHGAAYADPSVCRGGRRLGRSWGCPALPPALNRPIIDTIKGGSVLYIYGESRDHRS